MHSAQRRRQTTTVVDGYKSGYEDEDGEAEASQKNGYDENDERGDAAVTRRSVLERIK